MKRSDFIGATFFISGVLLFALMRLAMANYFTERGGYGEGSPSDLGELVRHELMIEFPYNVSLVFIVLGLVFLFFKDVKRLFSRLFVDET